MGCHPSLNYEEAMKLEHPNIEIIGGRHIRSENFPITIGRVMQAVMENYGIDLPRLLHLVICGAHEPHFEYIADWQLTKDGIELDDDAQSDECIEALLKLLT